MTRRWPISCGISVAAIIAGASISTSMADPSHRPLVIAGQQVLWRPNAAGRSVFLRYSVANEERAAPDAVNCRRIRPPHRLLSGSAISPTAFQAALSRAFARWQEAAGITFIEVPAGSEADIVVGEQSEPAGFAFTSLTLGPWVEGPIRPIASATICLNPAKRWKVGFDGNLAVYDLEHTLAHEIGHAIGLDHPSPRGHLMSFRYSEAIATLSEGDALGAATIYGPPSTRAATSARPTAIAIKTTAAATTVGRSLLEPTARR
ncbi:MAG: matrixin family metalloprotease [Hyphomicrobiaceae bacterium]|nr:matrixin family metalloprotease [Hyphomicrobiaceae bacterium]